MYFMRNAVGLRVINHSYGSLNKLDIRGMNIARAKRTKKHHKRSLRNIMGAFFMVSLIAGLFYSKKLAGLTVIVSLRYIVIWSFYEQY